VLDFSALADNTEANGLIVDGVLFQATKNGSSTNGVVIVDGGPGTTGNITPPNLVSLSDLNAIALIVSLPNLAIQFGYGYALDAAVSIPVATTIELFAGSAPVGSISFTGIPDPIFTGDYAGVASDTPFDRAVLTFSDVGDALRSIMWPLLRTELRTKDRRETAARTPAIERGVLPVPADNDLGTSEFSPPAKSAALPASVVPRNFRRLTPVCDDVPRLHGPIL